MSSNKEAREALIKRYGAECFIERLHLRDTTGLKYKGKGQYKKMKILTYHHIKKKSAGGKATIENGALLSAENHAWFHQQPIKKQKEMNEKFQQLKRNIDELKVVFVDDLDTNIKVLATEFVVKERERGEER